MNPTSQPPSYSQTTVPGQSAVPYQGCISKSFQVTGILHIVAGGLCVVLGIAAAVLEARFSYICIPILGGILFFITTGVIGSVYYCRPKSKCIVFAYIVMSIVSGVCGGIMFIVFIILAVQERSSMYHYEYDGECQPLNHVLCTTPGWARVMIDGLLCLVFSLEIGCGITSAVISCYKACKCCRVCCSCGCCEEDKPNSSVLYHAISGGDAVPMMAVPANQGNRPTYIAGPSAGPAAKPAQVMVLLASPQGQAFMPIQPGIEQTHPHVQGQVQGQQPIQPPALAPPMTQQVSMQGQVLPQGGIVHTPQIQQVQMIPASTVSPPNPVVQPPHGVIQHKHPPAGEPRSQEKVENTEPAQQPVLDAPGQVTSGQFSDQTALI